MRERERERERGPRNFKRDKALFIATLVHIAPPPTYVVFTTSRKCIEAIDSDNGVPRVRIRT